MAMSKRFLEEKAMELERAARSYARSRSRFAVYALLAEVYGVYRCVKENKWDDAESKRMMREAAGLERRKGRTTATLLLHIAFRDQRYRTTILNLIQKIGKWSALLREAYRQGIEPDPEVLEEAVRKARGIDAFIKKPVQKRAGYKARPKAPGLGRKRPATARKATKKRSGNQFSKKKPINKLHKVHVNKATGTKMVGWGPGKIIPAKVIKVDLSRATNKPSG